jgi:hypothetical protein
VTASKQLHTCLSSHISKNTWILCSLTMPQTRANAKTGADAKSDIPSANKENHSPIATSKQQDVRSSPQTAGRKRKPTGGDDDDVSPKHRRVSADEKTPSSAKETKKKQSDNKNGNEDDDAQQSKPRLTTPDPEFDYDRSQLRDPRPTPGRKARPR